MVFYYLGVDPGVQGAVVVLKEDRGILGTLSLSKATLRDVWNFLNRYDYRRNATGTVVRSAFAVLEKVGGYVAGSGGNTGSTMFNFGASYGALKAFLIAAGIPFEEVTPVVWQKAFHVAKRVRGETKTQWKNRLKGKAQQLFPNTKVTLATADALLLAEYSRRTYGRP